MEIIDKDVSAGNLSLTEDEQRTKQCIVVQHSTAEGENNFDVPTIKNKMAVAHLYLQKASFKRHPSCSNTDSTTTLNTGTRASGKGKTWYGKIVKALAFLFTHKI